MEIINGNCKEKCDQDGENSDDVKIDLEDQLDQLTEKLKNAMDTGVDLKESLGRWYIFFFSLFHEVENQENVLNAMKRYLKSLSWLEIKLTMKAVFSVNIVPQSTFTFNIFSL